MKTVQQQKFEKLTAAIIFPEYRKVFRKGVLDDIDYTKEKLYEFFCDKIYEFSLGKACSLAVDEYGTSYLCSDPLNNHFKLLTQHDYNPDIDDIVYYIDIALVRLEIYFKTRTKSIG